MLVVFVDRSRKEGEGCRVVGVFAVGGSEKERDLVGVREGEFVSKGGGMLIAVSIVQYRLLHYCEYLMSWCCGELTTGRSCHALVRSFAGRKVIGVPRLTLQEFCGLPEVWEIDATV